LLEGGLKWQALSLTPADMDFVALKEGAARDVALAFGVPPVLVGLPGDATYANAREAGRALYRQSVLPMATLQTMLGDWLEPVTLQVDTDQFPMWASGTVIIASSGGQSGQVTLFGEALKPPAPVALDASWQGNGDLQLSWTRRSRQGWSWIDEIDVPLGEAREQYRVTAIGAAASLEFETGQPSLAIAASTLGSAGSGPAAIEIRQIGDCAASRPARLNLVLP
jgi:hypothetical protein